MRATVHCRAALRTLANMLGGQYNHLDVWRPSAHLGPWAGQAAGCARARHVLGGAPARVRLPGRRPGAPARPSAPALPTPLSAAAAMLELAAVSAGQQPAGCLRCAMCANKLQSAPHIRALLVGPPTSCHFLGRTEWRVGQRSNMADRRDAPRVAAGHSVVRNSGGAQQGAVHPQPPCAPGRPSAALEVELARNIAT